MSRLSGESVERVRQAADIVEIVSGYTELRRRGARFVGLCPFHEERTPSFSVDPANNLYYCFGCQAGGDVFNFLEEKEGLDFRRALEHLADRYGVELSLEATDPAAEQRRRARDRLLQLLFKTAAFYSRYLWESAEAALARRYMEQRGLGREVLEQFGVGFAPSAWDRVLKSALGSGFSEQELQATGLAQKGRRGGLYDRFRARITFPLRDARGRVLGFGARAVRDSQQPKYVNSPEGPVYHKGRSLFGLDLARSHAAKAAQVIVVEGYTDVLALHQGGIRNSVASMGTALTEDQVAELARVAREVVLAFDADRSGQEAMLRVQQAAAGRQLDLKVLRLPDDIDPCDLLQQEGPDAFADRLGKAVSFLEFQVHTVIDRADLSSSTGKDRALAELTPVFAAAALSAERDEQLRHVADRLDLSEHLLAPLMARPAGGRAAAQAPLPSQRGTAARGERWERIFLAMCVSGGERGRHYLERLGDDHLSSDVLRRARIWIAEHFDAPTLDLPNDDPELAQAVSEIVVRASGQPADDQALEIGFLGLDRRRLEREIKVAAGVGDLERQRQLSLLRNETTEAIVRLMESEHGAYQRTSAGGDGGGSAE
jgi:DNA primase